MCNVMELIGLHPEPIAHQQMISVTDDTTIQASQKYELKKGVSINDQV